MAEGIKQVSLFFKADRMLNVYGTKSLTFLNGGEFVYQKQ